MLSHHPRDEEKLPEESHREFSVRFSSGRICAQSLKRGIATANVKPFPFLSEKSPMTSTGSSALRPAFLALSFILLALSFGANAFGVADHDRWLTFQADSEALAIGKIAQVTQAPFDPEALLALPCAAKVARAERHAAAIAAFPGNACERTYSGSPLVNAIPAGWTGWALSAIGVPDDRIVPALRGISGGLAALAVVWIMASVARLWTPLAGVGVGVGFFLVPHFTLMAPNLYWTPVLMLLPAAWLLQRARPGVSGVASANIAGYVLLLVLAMLSGFEFITDRKSVV